MPTFFFVFDAVPSSASPNASDIAGGKINVFVSTERAEDAEGIARAHVMDYAWIITGVEEARGPVPDHIPGLDAGVIALRAKAEREGVASEIVAWPKEERPEDGPIELRSAGPKVSDDKQH